MLNHELYVFIQVVKSGSFTNASSELFVTPASVMKQMNQLEEQLNVKLVNRTHQGISLTPSGHLFYEEAQKIVELTENAIRSVQHVEQPDMSTITIGTSLLNPCQPLINLYNELPVHEHLVQFQLIPFEDNFQKILEVLSSLGKEIDIIFGACGSSEWKKRANFFEMGNYAHCIAMPRTHPLAHQPLLSISDLSGQSILIGKAGDVPEIDSLRHFLRENNVTLLDVNTNYDATIFNRCEQMNCLLLTLESWKNIHPSLVTIPVSWDFKIPFGILYAQTPSEKVVQFINAMSSSTG